MEFVEEVTETLEDMNVDPEVEMYSIRLDQLEELDWEDHEEIVLMAPSSSRDDPSMACPAMKTVTVLGYLKNVVLDFKRKSRKSLTTLFEHFQELFARYSSRDIMAIRNTDKTLWTSLMIDSISLMIIRSLLFRHPLRVALVSCLTVIVEVEPMLVVPGLSKKKQSPVDDV